MNKRYFGGSQRSQRAVAEIQERRALRRPRVERPTRTREELNRLRALGITAFCEQQRERVRYQFEQSLARVLKARGGMDSGGPVMWSQDTFDVETRR